MDRKQIRTVLLGIPGALVAVGTFAAIWETPRTWIGDQFSVLAVAMTNPFVTMAVTLLLVAYFGALIWTFVEPRLAPVSGAELREVEADKERRSRRRKILNEARQMVADFELQSRWSWRQMIRYNPAFASVRPHLSKEYMEAIRATRTAYASDEWLHDPLAAMFLSELDRLEREWGLS